MFFVFAILAIIGWTVSAALSSYLWEEVLHEYADSDLYYWTFGPLALVFILILIAVQTSLFFISKIVLEKSVTYVKSRGGIKNVISPSARKLYEMEQDYNELLKLIEYQPKPDSYWKIKELEWELNSKSST